MTTPSRRTVLRSGLVLTGGSLAVAVGCTPESDPTYTDPSGVQTPSGPESPSGAESPAGDGSANPQPDGPSVAKADVPEGGGVVISEGGDYVVTQPEAGEYKAFSSICTHQGCPVAEVADNEILCNCHGSAFSAADGSVLQGPAETALEAATVAESGDQLVVS